ncbi:MAG: hypothetical protein ACK5JS_08410 [Mangrovibacterium sp.]
MKTFRLLLVAIIATMAIASCTTEHESTSLDIDTFPYSTWEYENPNGTTSRIKFAGKTDCSYRITSSLGAETTTLYTYTHSDETVVMTPKEDAFAVLEGTVSDSTMVVYNEDTGDFLGRFKQK